MVSRTTRPINILKFYFPIFLVNSADFIYWTFAKFLATGNQCVGFAFGTTVFEVGKAFRIVFARNDSGRFAGENERERLLFCWGTHFDFDLVVRGRKSNLNVIWQIKT